MMDQMPTILMLAPFIGAVGLSLLAWRRPAAAMPVVFGALAITVLAAVLTLREVLANGTITYLLSGWDRLPERAAGMAVGIEYKIDAFNALVLVLIPAIALINALYLRTRLAVECAGKEILYAILYLLLVVGLCGMVITNDAFNLYVLLEISSLTSYALIGIGRRRAAHATFNYIMTGTIGASFFLLGVGYLYIQVGTLNIGDIHEALMASSELRGLASIKVAAMMIMAGLWLKMGLFPLHGWLPNAYRYAPTATGSLMAPLVTKVMVVVMLRMMVSLFGLDYLFAELNWRPVIVGIACVAILAGSFFALAQRDIRGMLCFLIVAEVGYMVGGAWLGNEAGITGAAYHVLSDACMTFCLFLAVAAIILRTGEHRLSAFRGAFRKMPVAMAAFTVGALSMVGLPPTCGFFSKWYLLIGGVEAGQWHYVACLLISSLVNAVLFFRIFEIALMKVEVEESGSFDVDALPEDPEDRWERVPVGTIVAMIVAATAVLTIGLLNRPIASFIATWIGQAVEVAP